MRRQSLLLLLPFLSMSCGGGEEPSPALPVPLRLPGRLLSPEGTVVDCSADTLAVLYYWIPIEGYEPGAGDLEEIARLRDEGWRIFPVQPDEASRNAAQLQANNLGIPLPVFLADSEAAVVIPAGVTPVAISFRRGGATAVETGRGCVGRLLGL